MDLIVQLWPYVRSWGMQKKEPTAKSPRVVPCKHQASLYDTEPK